MTLFILCYIDGLTLFLSYIENMYKYIHILSKLSWYYKLNVLNTYCFMINPFSQYGVWKTDCVIAFFLSLNLTTVKASYTWFASAKTINYFRPFPCNRPSPYAARGQYIYCKFYSSFTVKSIFLLPNEANRLVSTNLNAFHATMPRLKFKRDDRFLCRLN